jgi:hypothetical protein
MLLLCSSSLMIVVGSFAFLLFCFFFSPSFWELGSRLLLVVLDDEEVAVSEWVSEWVGERAGGLDFDHGRCDMVSWSSCCFFLTNLFMGLIRRERFWNKRRVVVHFQGMLLCGEGSSTLHLTALPHCPRSLQAATQLGLTILLLGKQMRRIKSENVYSVTEHE